MGSAAWSPATGPSAGAAGRGGTLPADPHGREPAAITSRPYGLTYRALERGGRAEWFLNYRGGSFLVPGDAATTRDAALAGVTSEPLGEGQVTDIKAQIQQQNMDAVPLEKPPKVAVYAPPNASPWDDAVTMVLNYAGIAFEKVWDTEVLAKGLTKFDWLHLHHEDFTGQYSKFFLNYSGAPWLADMVARNQAVARQLGYPNVPGLKRAVAEEIRAFVDRRVPAGHVHRHRDPRPRARLGQGRHRGQLRRRLADGPGRRAEDGLEPSAGLPGGAASFP